MRELYYNPSEHLYCFMTAQEARKEKGWRKWRPEDDHEEERDFEADLEAEEEERLYCQDEDSE